jgi:KUP system potassium uptake protein
MAESSGPPDGPSDKDGPIPAVGADRPSAEADDARASESARPSEVSGFHQAATQGREHAPLNPSGRRLAILSLGALGVVYGDIGTSPLYAIQSAFNTSEKGHGFPVSEAAVYGVLSMIVWSLVVVVAIKYIYFILRADNRGEGGVLSLLALLLQTERRDEDKRRRWLLIAIGLFGSALLYGDGMITPAISVLGALQGIEVRNPQLPHTIIVGLAVLIIAAVFAVQRFGTARVGAAFGPMMGLWFGTIAVLGAREVFREPEIFWALNPAYAVRFFIDHGLPGFIILGSVVLVITGAEALYADMGHFGKRPIRLAWFGFVMPALLLNYFGQGALLLRDPTAADNPFYKLAPAGFQIPLIVIATLAAIIASQALISGAFSLTQQSIQLGYSPRMTIVHTSHTQVGQIYIPEVNKLLAVGTILLVAIFQDADRLGSAYGIAVTGTMGVTSILFHFVATTKWGWSRSKMAMLTGFFLTIDGIFLLSNTFKIIDGGWIPIAIAIGVYTLMSTWKRGRLMLTSILRSGSLPLDLFLKDVEKRKPPRVPGTAVFMTSTADGVPVVLLHHLKHNKVLHEQVILMSVKTDEVPEIDDKEERVTVEKLEQGFWRVEAHYGFMETPNVPELLHYAKRHNLRAKQLDTTFYLGRERIIIAGSGPKRAGTRRAADPNALRMARWRKRIFIVMSRNARSATEFFGIPPNRVVELGAQVEF